MMPQKKIDQLNQKIASLDLQRQKIEAEMAQQLLAVLKAHGGFALPFDGLVGGLIEVIQTAKSDVGKLEDWQLAGGKFLKSRGRSSRSQSPSRVLSEAYESTSSTAKVA